MGGFERTSDSLGSLDHLVAYIQYEIHNYCIYSYIFAYATVSLFSYGLIEDSQIAVAAASSNLVESLQNPGPIQALPAWSMETHDEGEWIDTWPVTKTHKFDHGSSGLQLMRTEPWWLLTHQEYSEIVSISSLYEPRATTMH